MSFLSCHTMVMNKQVFIFLTNSHNLSKHCQTFKKFTLNVSLADNLPRFFLGGHLKRILMQIHFSEINVGEVHFYCFGSSQISLLKFFTQEFQHRKQKKIPWKWKSFDVCQFLGQWIFFLSKPSTGKQSSWKNN